MLPLAIKFFVQQSIARAVTSSVAITIIVIQAKHDDNILFLYKLIEKSFLLKNFSFAILFFDPDAAFKVLFSANTLLKRLIKR